jgi:hypothetical protein
MAISYSVQIDLDDDGDFDDAGEDLSSDVLALDWRLGMDAPYQSVAEAGQAAIRLRNRDQRYSPEINAILPGQTLRIQSDDGTTTRTHFAGQVEHVAVQTGDQGQREAVIHAVDAARAFETQRLRLPPQIEVRADEVIEAVLDALPLRRAVLATVWLLGRVNHSELGTNTRLAGITIPRSLESGKTILNYVGDVGVGRE